MADYPADWNGVYLALRDLGDDEDEIAATLAARGIKGERRKDRCCPIANYLRTVFGEECGPQVDEGSIHLDMLPDDWMRTDALPGFGEFVEGFDDGDYPELDLEAA